VLLSAYDFEGIAPPQSRSFHPDITAGGVVGDKRAKGFFKLQPLENSCEG
jgi:hypothetical protein